MDVTRLSLKVQVQLVFVLIALAIASLASPASAVVAGEGKRATDGGATDNILPGQYIVVLEDSVKGPATVARNQVEARGGKLGFVYRHALNGYSAKLSRSAVAELNRDPRVKYVSPVRKFAVQAQTNPTGIGRIGAPENESIDIDEEDDARVDVDVAVIDSGIDYEHPDLDVVERANCIPPNKFEEPEAMECVEESGEDDDGHGTHVAGTIGAIDNGEGVVGVAAGARLWAVKVATPAFGSTLASTAWIIAGIDWVTARAEQIEVVNMSLGGEGESPALDEAIATSVEAGVVYVVAAGNSADDTAYYAPASSPDAITVSALADTDGEPGGEGPEECYDSIPELTRTVTDDQLAWFSNWGAPVDLAAPGVCILSTYPGGEYGTSSGTSMASPHVAGAAAVLASESNPNDKEDVEAIRQALVEKGSLDWTDTSGDPDPEPLLYVGDPALPSGVQTAGVTSIDTATHTATLRGIVNPGGLETAYHFEYGATTDYGHSVPASPASAGAGSKNVNVSTPMSAFSGVTYHYRIVATNSEGTFYGDDRAFTPARWTRQETPEPEVISNLYDVSCPSLSECVAVGRYFHVLGEVAGLPSGNNYAQIERWNGSEWAIEPIELPAEPAKGVSSSLVAVSCTSASFCMAVGDSTSGAFAERWDGSEWSLASLSLPSNAELHDVTCLSSEWCVAVGETPGLTGGTVVGEWNGSEWAAVESPDLPETQDRLKGVSCLSPNSCVAVGSSGLESSYSAETLIETWDGSSWEIQSSPNLPEVGNRLMDVSCTSASDCIAVGGTYYEVEAEQEWEAAELRSGPLAVRWDGEEWSLDSPGRPLSGISCTAADSCFGVGEGDRLAIEPFEPEKPEYGPQPRAVAEYWNGEQWSGLGPVLFPAIAENATLEDVSCMPKACTAVGSLLGRSAEGLAVRLTANAPSATTEAATRVMPEQATLHATVNPERDDENTTYQFEYGTTAEYGIKAPASPSEGSGYAGIAVSEVVKGLTPNQLYHYRIVATNSSGTTYGVDETFTTRHTPFLEPLDGEFPISFSLLGLEMTLQGPSPISCTTPKEGPLAVDGEGEFSDEISGTATLTLHNCLASGTKCTTPGEASGTVKTEDLPFRLVYLSDGKPGIVFLPNAESGKIMTAKCTYGLVSIEIAGSGVLGQILDPGLGETASALAIDLSATETGEGEYVQKYTETDEGAEYGLTESVNGGGAEAATLDGVALAAFDNEEEVKLVSGQVALEPTEGEFPFSLSLGGEGTVMLHGLAPVSCVGEGEVDPVGGEGQLDDETSGTATLTLHNCRSSGTKCTTPGEAAGTVKTEDLPFRLVYLSDGKPGIVFLPNAESGKILTAKCAFGLILIEIAGSGVLGQIVDPDFGETASALAIDLSVTETGEGEYVQKYTETGEGTEYGLMESVNGGGAEATALEAEVTESFDEGEAKLTG